MKILTWNIERLQKNKNQLILERLLAFNADIVVLTETSTAIHLGAAYHVLKTEALALIHDQQKYKAGENRVSIWSKFPIKKSYRTFFSKVCVSTNLLIICGKH